MQQHARFEHMWAAFLLAWVAAFSDAIGFLVLQQLGASFMSGNSMATGVALGRLNWHAALHSGLPIIIFFIGNMLGFLVRTLARRWHLRSPFAIIFALELVLLLAFLLWGSRSFSRGSIRPFESGVFYVCTVLLTLAMGLQTATVRRVQGEYINTTFITGVLSNWARVLAQYLPWLREQLVQRSMLQVVRTPVHHASVRHFVVLSGLWVSYLLGAICGGVLELRFALTALVFPMVILVGLIVVDLVWPLELERF
ncbi:YoaK family protein [Dictyobacter aurantiacus]|uniref:DUF1275 family protein n=1 Tax=Dictyobacter aurantiacus TaxID=1936993 RepID=A0A401ZKD2_9CHLR|nr:YoaK family protein [Dictyobacter aurantiacus]GCE07321.1 DUF1275 family protein [Dictyobacter aurantiacus]